MDSWRLLRWFLDNAITELKQAGTYKMRGQKRDADGNVVMDKSSHPLAAENRVSMESLVTASVALTGAVHQDGRFVLAPATERLRNFDDVQRELSEYMKLRVENVSACPLQWWREHKQFFPGLAVVARSFLCLPATSAAVERFFSASGLTISHLRTRLSSETVEQLLFLKLNWDDFFYTVRLPRPARATADNGGEEEVVVVGEEKEEEEEEDEEGAEGEGEADEDDDAFFALSLLSLVAAGREPAEGVGEGGEDGIDEDEEGPN
jgi:hypothetical protein